MTNPISSDTYIRSLNYDVRHKLSDFLDPQDCWKKVIISIYKPSGEARYSQHHVRRFEALAEQGKSPTMALLNDWGTSNCTVGQLVDILKGHRLFAPASVLLPDRGINPVPADIQTTPLRIETLSDTLKMVVGETGQLLPDSVSAEEYEPDETGFFRFSFCELRRITGNFDDQPVSRGGSRLGEGGFGIVYKGQINAKPVAVKKLSCIEDILIDELKVQFNQEIQTLKMLKHENLVDMVGFSCDGHHPCLVYAYMLNGSLLDRLACLDDTPSLSWQTRCLITVGTARGLEYLHRNHHVHRDVKSGNILLDEELVPKISDFGLTRASAKHSSTTMMTERVVGTKAYMAPEAYRGEITPKSDVFSLGVVLLEILSGRPPVNENHQPQFLMEVKDEIEEEELTLEDFLDKKMIDWVMPQVERIYSIACNCLCDRKNRRPAIKEVLTEFEDMQSISLEQSRHGNYAKRS